MNEQLQQPKNYNWTPGESYYEDIAESHVNDAVHVIGRLALGLYSYIRLGRPKVVVDPEFKEMKDIVAQGNGLVASVHRLDLDTVLLPSALERAGLHHARPMSKIELFQKRLVRWGLHKLGAFAVDRNVDAVDMDGLAIAQKGILKRTETTEKKRYGILRRKERNGIVTIYPEATRINKDTLRVAKIKRGLAITAIENSSWIVPVGIAGLSVEKRGSGKDKRNIAWDRRSWFGLRNRVVFTMGKPFKLPPHSKDALEDETGRLRLEEINAGRDIIKKELQKQLDKAYEIRGSSLEVKTEEYLEEIRNKSRQ